MDLEIIYLSIIVIVLNKVHLSIYQYCFEIYIIDAHHCMYVYTNVSGVFIRNFEKQYIRIVSVI